MRKIDDLIGRKQLEGGLMLKLWLELADDGRPTLMGQYPDGFTHWQAKFDSWEMAKRMFPNVEVRIKI